MRCAKALGLLSPYRDGELEGPLARDLEVHLGACPPCAARRAGLDRALSLLGALPRTEISIVPHVLARLEVESREPGLALLFRPVRARRPLMFPSLVSATALLGAIVAGFLSLTAPLAAPALVLSGLTIPAIQARGPEEGAWSGVGEGSLFLQTVVGPDGSVASVRLLEGSPVQARSVVQALWKDRFEPARLRGRPVAVSVLRLVSRLDVWAPLT